jgi:ABC-type branched-subunit amino acid transport system ATPase component
MTVLENVRAALQRQLGTSFHFWKSEPRLHHCTTAPMQLLAEVDLQDFADELTVNLPYGRKRALELATTMALEPELMLLDEPTQGMGHEDVDRVTQTDQEGVGWPHHPDGGAQHERGVVHRRPHHGAAARRHHCRRHLRRGVGQPQVIEAYMGTADANCKGRTEMSTELLRIENLHAWYGESHILHGVDLSVNEGEVVTLLGRNGAGRTTTMRAIVGLTGTARARSASTAKKPSSWRRTRWRTWAWATARKSAAFFPA